MVRVFGAGIDSAAFLVEHLITRSGAGRSWWRLAARVAEDEGTWMLRSTRLGDWLRVLECAVQEVKLKHEKMWLEVLEELSRLQIQRYIQLLAHLSYMLQVVYEFLSVNGILEQHGCVRLILWVRHKQQEDAR